VAPELVAELGEPFGRLWGLLMDSHGPREGSEVLARVVGAVHEHGEQVVRDALEASLSAGRRDLLGLRELCRHPRGRVEVPAALAGYEVEGARASDYDVLLEGGAP
jgi:hypothetical protein